MKDLVEKFTDLERKLSQERGDLSLFALFLREDAVDKWDLILASPWIELDRKEALAYITNRIQEMFSPDELSFLSRVVCVDQANPSVESMNRAIRINHGRAEIRDSNFFGMQIKHAYIITSQRLDAEAQVPA
jgi:hypothetical protein